MDQVGGDVAGANVTITDQNGKLIGSAPTNSSGQVDFLLVGVTIDSSGSHAAGNYNVTATANGQTANRTTTIAGNQQVPINLTFTVSELTSVLIVPFILAALIVFAVAFRKLKLPSRIQSKLG
jgi:hypothetical protein